MSDWDEILRGLYWGQLLPKNLVLTQKFQKKIRLNSANIDTCQQWAQKLTPNFSGFLNINWFSEKVVNSTVRQILTFSKTTKLHYAEWIVLPKLSKLLASFVKVRSTFSFLGPQSFRNPVRPSKKGVITFDPTAHLVLVIALNFLRQLVANSLRNKSSEQSFAKKVLFLLLFTKILFLKKVFFYFFGNNFWKTKIFSYTLFGKNEAFEKLNI